jgi:hypothetical protein
MTTRKTPIVAGKKAVQDRIPGINRVTAKLAGGREAVYYYHRATGTKLPGAYGSREFLDALAAARAGTPKRTDGTLAGLIRAFEGTAKWRKLAESTRKEYTRVFKFWDEKFGTVPVKAVEARGFREDVLEWHDRFSADKPREADNRVTGNPDLLTLAAHVRATFGAEQALHKALGKFRIRLEWYEANDLLWELQNEIEDAFLDLAMAWIAEHEPNSADPGVLARAFDHVVIDGHHMRIILREVLAAA